MHIPSPLCLQVAYGTTENSPVTFMGFPQDSISQRTETVGCIFPHTEVSIILPTFPAAPTLQFRVAHSCCRPSSLLELQLV